MRNIWLIIKREYLERVRTTSFVVLTLLAPAIMTVVMILPAKLATMGEKTQHIVVVTSTPQFGEMVREQLSSADAEDDDTPASGAHAANKKQSSNTSSTSTPIPPKPSAPSYATKWTPRPSTAIFG